MDQVHPDQVGPEVVIGVSARNWLIERDALLVPRYVNDDVERQWTSHKPDGKDTISWEEYRFYTIKDISCLLLPMNQLFPTGKMYMVSLMKRMQKRKSMASHTSRWKLVIQGGGPWLIWIIVESWTFR